MKSRKNTTKNDTGLFYTYIFCIILATILRVAYILIYRIPVRDSYSYVSLIKEWIASGTMSDQQNKLSLMILGTAARIFKTDIFKSGIATNAAIGIIIICLAIDLSYKSFKSVTIALCVGIVVSTHPNLAVFSTQLLRENIYLLFILLGIKSLLNYTGFNKTVNILLTGICFSTASLCRLEGFEFLPIAVVFYLFLFRKDLKKAFTSIMLFTVASLLAYISLMIAFDLSCDYLDSEIMQEKIDFNNTDKLFHNA